MEIENYRLKLVHLADVQRLLDLINTNRARLQKYFPITSSSITSLETATNYINKRTQDAKIKLAFSYLIEEKSSGDLIGMYILKNLDWRIPKCELAYFIDENHEGKGIISKITKEVIAFCFNDLELNKIWIETGEDNFGSQKIALKNGFKREGLLRNNFRSSDGNLINVEYYGLIKEDWMLSC